MARTVLVWVAVLLPAAAWAQVPPDLDAYEKRFVGRTIRADHGPGFVWTVLPNQWVDVEGHGISRYNYFFLSDRNAVVATINLESGTRCDNVMGFDGPDHGTISSSCLPGQSGNWRADPPYTLHPNVPDSADALHNRQQGMISQSLINGAVVSEFRLLSESRFEKKAGGQIARGDFYYTPTASDRSSSILEYDNGSYCFVRSTRSSRTSGTWVSLCGVSGRSLTRSSGEWRSIPDPGVFRPTIGPTHTGPESGSTALAQLSDLNGDSMFDQQDALALYYAFALENLLGDGESGGVARFRQTLLRGIRGAMPDSDAGYRELLRRAHALRNGTCPAR